MRIKRSHKSFNGLPYSLGNEYVIQLDCKSTEFVNYIVKLYVLYKCYNIPVARQYST